MEATINAALIQTITKNYADATAELLREYRGMYPVHYLMYSDGSVGTATFQERQGQDLSDVVGEIVIQQQPYIGEATDADLEGITGDMLLDMFGEEMRHSVIDALREWEG